MKIFYRNEEVNSCFSFNWDTDFSTENKLKLKNGNEANFIVRIFTEVFSNLNIWIFLKVFKELTDAYSENTDQFNRATLSLYVQPALHLTNLLPIDIQCSIDVS